MNGRGMSAGDAIELLRESRSPMVLSNLTFVEQLLNLEDGRSEWEK